MLSKKYINEEIAKAVLVPAVDYNDMNEHMYVGGSRQTHKSFTCSSHSLL